jgi:hypothetical protein
MPKFPDTLYNSVGAVTRLYGLNVQGIEVRFSATTRDISLFHSFQTSFGTRPSSSPSGAGGY